MTASTTDAPIQTQIDNNTPILVASMNPAQFDSLIKLLMVLEKQDNVIIKDSIICQSINVGATILYAELQSIIGTGVNMHILAPRKAIKLFKAIKGNTNIAVYDDDLQKRYIVTNGGIKVFLPKQASEMDEDISPPNLKEYSMLGKTISITKDARSNILPVLNECDHCELLIKDTQMKGVYVPETAVYLFDDYSTEPIDETTSDLNLKAYSFLGIDAESYEIFLGQKGDNYWTMCRANTGYLTVDIYESVQAVTDESFLL